MLGKSGTNEDRVTPPAAAGQPGGTSNRRVLIVEDDDRVVEAVRAGLAKRQTALDHAATVAQGRRLMATGDAYDVVVLDLTLPDGDGARIAEECRAAGRTVPIIMVSAKDHVEERVAGLRRGADDYLCKPFAVEELLARIDAVLRRARREAHHVLSYADVKLDLVRRRVRRGGRKADLSTREMELLAYLMSHPDEVLSRAQILREVWDIEGTDDTAILRVYMNYLRNKLGLPSIIHTVRNVGYVLSREHPDERAVF